MLKIKLICIFIFISSTFLYCTEEPLWQIIVQKDVGRSITMCIESSLVIPELPVDMNMLGDIPILVNINLKKIMVYSGGNFLIGLDKTEEFKYIVVGRGVKLGEIRAVQYINSPEFD